MVFMGPRSEPFCRQAVRVLDQNRHIVPPSLDVDGAKADLAAIDQLRPVVERLRRLVSQLDDTLLALGSDVMVTTLEGYGQLKLSGAAHGLETTCARKSAPAGHAAAASRRPSRNKPAPPPQDRRPPPGGLLFARTGRARPENGRRQPRHGRAQPENARR